MGSIHTDGNSLLYSSGRHELHPEATLAGEMKPLISETKDTEALVELGRAAVQVVHDLKNQLNGLKLYATFLRKRLEKAERPADELETLAKLIAGLERAAEDTSALVRYGRPLQLRRAPGTDLARLVASAAEGATIKADAGPHTGEFDALALIEALKSITQAARGGGQTEAALEIRLRREETEGGPAAALVEWRGAGVAAVGRDAFGSFAGASGLRLALAAKVIRAHGGEAAQEADTLRVRLPLKTEVRG